MRSVFAILSFVASACAYQVITPGGASGWTLAGPNQVTWQRVDTDPLNFTILLVNQNNGVMPNGPQVLAALVDGTQNSFTVSPPSTGFQVGDGFQVNLVKDSQSLNSILAQSTKFSIKVPTSSSSSSSALTAPSPIITPTNQPAPTTDGSGSNDLNPTDSVTNTTPTNDAGRLSAAGSVALMLAAFAAIVV
ncbi:hypothetical protein BC834DRAFT_191944 [Gloeopeniophorella convolvens]|nr:hypothetical protein BC834DRAFT_191944 [Gloeopeniophorella convolvens]